MIVVTTMINTLRESESHNLEYETQRHFRASYIPYQDNIMRVITQLIWRKNVCIKWRTNVNYAFSCVKDHIDYLYVGL